MLAEEIYSNALKCALEILSQEESTQELGLSPELPTQEILPGFRNGVSVDLNDLNIIESDPTDSDPDLRSRSSSRSRRSNTNSNYSSKRSSKLGMLTDDSTVRNMFRRYLCSPSKDSEIIKVIKLLEEQNVIFIWKLKLVSLFKKRSRTFTRISFSES